jgi:molecular chaperone GrpE
MKKNKHQPTEEPKGNNTEHADSEAAQSANEQASANDTQAYEANVIPQEEVDSEWKDKYLRLAAEFDNYRRRTLNEKIELTKMAGQDILKNILPVVDDFERGLATVKNTDDHQAIVEGMDLIYLKFKEFLKRNGVVEMDALHADFDSDHHEALTKIPAPSDELKGKIVDVLTKGYTLNDKVIRFAKVVIGE